MGCGSSVTAPAALSSSAPSNPLSDSATSSTEGQLVSLQAPAIIEESTWCRYGGEELEPLLEHVDLIDASWLLKLAKGEVMPERKGIVLPWQHLPQEAKVSLAQLRCSSMRRRLPVAVLSYGWAAHSHPDPSGHLLRRLIPALESMVHSCTHGTSATCPSWKPATWGLIWDFMSLPQRGYTTGYSPTHEDRTPLELTRFRMGLGSINVWYGAKYATVLVADWPMPDDADNKAPLDKRGWCIFERYLSSISKHSNCCLTLRRTDSCRQRYWNDVATMCKASRLPPLAPDAFEKMLRTGMAREEVDAGTGICFTNGHDATEICIPQYREGFLRLMGAGGELVFAGCNWKDPDLSLLAAALAYAHNEGVSTPAHKLYLSNNKLTGVGLAPLLDTIATGALPEMRELFLERNMGLGDAGAFALASALSQGHLCRLNALHLDHTGMGDAGVRALCGVLQSAPSLERLYIGANAFGEEASGELSASCSACGVTIIC